MVALHALGFDFIEPAWSGLALLGAAYGEELRRLGEQTGCPVIVNTSFNVRGEPIVCTPDDAYRCFMRTAMDALVVESFIFTKTAQPHVEDSTEWKEEFVLD